MMVHAVTPGCLAFASLLALASPAALPGDGPGEPATDRAALGIAPAASTIRNLTWLDAAGARAEATFVDPPGDAPHPGVLFVHWLDPGSTSNGRTQFLPDALALARLGVASLVVDTPWSDPQWYRTRDLGRDMVMSETMLKNLSRALDLLAALDHVDAARLGYVGHDFGAMFGATLASRDRRPAAWVYIAGTDRYAEWFTLGRRMEPAARDQVFTAFRALDPVETIGATAPSPLLLQFADKDRFVTRQAAEALIAAAGASGEAKFYDCGHEMNRHAMDDRVAWLAAKLAKKPLR
jgi:dienelactone hydrolase